MNEADFERAISVAMNEMGISLKRAMSELYLYMCSHGSIEDFKNYTNYFIKNQHKIREVKLSRRKNKEV